MGYEQVDGVKNILVNEDGKIRQGLRTLPWDDERIEYEYDNDGNPKNEWPLIVVDIDEDGTEDKRPLPALVMKEHGKLPRNLPVSRGDFKAKNGKKLPPHCNLDNIEYVGDGKYEGQKPYKGSPDEEEADKPKPKKPPEGQKVEHKTADEDTPESSGLPDELAQATNEKVAEKESGSEESDEETKQGKPDVASSQAPDAEPSDLMKGSKELTAKRAIEIIRNFEYSELVDLDFYSEDEREDGARVTVEDEWKRKKKNAQ